MNSWFFCETRGSVFSAAFRKLITERQNAVSALKIAAPRQDCVFEVTAHGKRRGDRQRECLLPVGVFFL